MVTAQKQQLNQEISGPICPNCGNICEVRNFSTGGTILTSRGVVEDIHEDFRFYCLNCGEYVDDPIVDTSDCFEDIFDVPF